MEILFAHLKQKYLLFCSFPFFYCSDYIYLGRIKYGNIMAKAENFMQLIAGLCTGLRCLKILIGGSPTLIQKLPFVQPAKGNSG